MKSWLGYCQFKFEVSAPGSGPTWDEKKPKSSDGLLVVKGRLGSETAGHEDGDDVDVDASAKENRLDWAATTLVEPGESASTSHIVLVASCGPAAWDRRRRGLGEYLSRWCRFLWHIREDRSHDLNFVQSGQTWILSFLLRRWRRQLMNNNIVKKTTYWVRMCVSRFVFCHVLYRQFFSVHGSLLAKNTGQSRAKNIKAKNNKKNNTYSSSGPWIL